ncbi:MAG: acetate--CoA ligase family protein [Pseudomonadota bacterium]
MSALSRLFNPESIVVIGGGAWGEAVLHQAQKFGFAGELYAVHPSKPEIAGIATWKGAHLLPKAPDAAFIGINREATVGAVERLRKKGTGGAVCFASGFAEATAEDATGADAQERLLRAAQDMPILGPNCYGFINAFDQVAIWPDQHGLVPVDRGVAILTQSSNISINLTMQARALPIGYMITSGNQAQTTQADIASALLDDPRVTAIGLHIEGLNDLAAWHDLALKAAEKGVPLVALKVGVSDEARSATASHTASLAGDDAGAQALFDRLGIARVDDLTSFIETLKLLHVAGPLASPQIGSISCSGGEASLAADLGAAIGISFPKLTKPQSERLRSALGPKVALANPLDYHTYIWRDEDAMVAAWSAMADPGLAALLIIVDFPRSDRCDPADWDCAINAALRVRAETDQVICMAASLPELMPEHVAQRLIEGGVVPLNGLSDALKAIRTSTVLSPDPTPPLLPGGPREAALIDEAAAKQKLKSTGADIPEGKTLNRHETPPPVDFPVVVKSLGIAHKTGANAIALNIRSEGELRQACASLQGDRILVEQMVPDVITELLIGVIRDPAHGFVLTLGAGGTLTELWNDTVSMLVPVTSQQIDAALDSLRIAPVLRGYRGRSATDRAAIIDAVLAIQCYVVANASCVAEVEVNPLLCTATSAIVGDALIREAP